MKRVLMGSITYLGLLFILGVFTLSGCGQSLQQKSEKIQKGMSKAEVIAIMGQPEAIDWAGKDDPIVKWFYGITSLRKPGRVKDGYYFTEGDADIFVGFINDKVMDAGPNLDGRDKFVKTEDLPRVRSKVDNLYERDLEKRID